MKKIKLALVSYINTIPFIEAIKSSDVLKEKVELVIDYPARCAELIRTEQVDGGLIPVGALHEAKSYKTITNYCIGANGAVDTVVLFSNQELEEVDTIFLDYQSRSSVQLVKILAKQYWKKDFTYLPTTRGFEDNIPQNSAILMIGDRVFNYENIYKYKLDLAENWKHYTKLPFAFAVWVGNKRAQSIEKELNKAFAKQLLNIDSCFNKMLTIDKSTFVNYLTNKIDYSFDVDKKKAIQLFTSLLTNS